jgi:hypothetical protein
MKSITTKHNSAQQTAVYLFDDWFDPIEARCGTGCEVLSKRNLIYRISFDVFIVHGDQPHLAKVEIVASCTALLNLQGYAE